MKIFSKNRTTTPLNNNIDQKDNNTNIFNIIKDILHQTIKNNPKQSLISAIISTTASAYLWSPEKFKKFFYSNKTRYALATITTMTSTYLIYTIYKIKTPFLENLMMQTITPPIEIPIYQNLKAYNQKKERCKSFFRNIIKFQ